RSSDLANPIHDDATVLLEGVSRVRELARGYLEPARRATLARHDADACASPFLPAKRQATVAPPLHHDRRRVEKDGVAFGQREIVHEAGGAHVDDPALGDLPRAIDAVERQVGTRELVAEGEQLARAGVDLSVRGEGRVDAAEV